LSLLVEYSCSDGIAVIELNRPEVLNALSDDMVRAYKSALIHFDEDDSALVAVVTGRGRAFCTGADVRQRQLRPREEMIKYDGPQERDARVPDIMLWSTNFKPVIAAVHGYAVGGGLMFSLMAEVLVAEADTKFQVTELNRGIGGHNLWSLMAWKGCGPVTETVLAGRFFSAEQAHKWGIVDRVVESGARVEVAREIAREIAAMPPLAVREIVRMRHYQMARMRLDDQTMGPRGLHLTADFRRSAEAFVNKSGPVSFTGE
jgi:enoyl-CoA hydratase/carnithine racemase